MRTDPRARHSPIGPRSRLVEAQRRHPSMRAWNAPGPGRRRGRRRTLLRVTAAVVVVAGLGAFGLVVTGDPVRLTVSGLDEGQVLDKQGAEQLAVQVDTAGVAASDVSARVNGTPAELEDGPDGKVLRPGALLREGTNEIEVRVAGRFPFGDEVVTRRFDAVLTGARLAVPRQTLRTPAGVPVVVRGLVDEAVSLDVNGVAVPIDGGGFTAEVSPEVDEVRVRATHANGNVTEEVVQVVYAVERVEHPETRAVHVTAAGWADPAIRGAIVAMAVDGSINAVQLDIKDEGGEVGFRAKAPLAVQAGAVSDHYEPAAAVAELHALGVRVIGRIVCFLDPVVAQWAWSSGRPDMVVQAAGGTSPLDNEYGSAAFTSFASPEVQDYLIDLAVEAAEAGFDEILYDYVRRPEGDMAAMNVPGLDRPADVEIARFVRDTDVALAPYDVELGVSVFGISVTRPAQIAQDVRLLAPHVDYVAPMVYPSHWGAGEYNVADPNRSPRDIVERSVADFVRAVAGSGAAVVPWLQAFSEGGVTYGPDEVRAQIDGAMHVGSSGFLLWNSGSLYDAAALAPR